MFTKAPIPAQLAAAAPHLPVVLYDGACAFCTAQAERVKRISGGRIAVRPLQVALADVPWVDPDEAIRALHLVDRDGRTYAGAAAIVRLLRLTRPVLGVLVLPYHLPGHPRAGGARVRLRREPALRDRGADRRRGRRRLRVRRVRGAVGRPTAGARAAGDPGGSPP